LKIHFLLSNLGTGGAERVGSLLTGAWAELGHEVTLITTYSKADTPETGLSPKVRHLSIATLIGHRSGPLRSWPFRVQALTRLFRSDRPDIVCSFLSNVNVAAIVAARRAGIPVVVSERTYPPALRVGAGWALARRLLYPKAQAVVMQTQDGLRWLEKAIPSARGEVIANPVALPVPETHPRVDPATVCTPGRRILLTVGRLSEEKRFGLLITAFAALGPQHGDWHLVILGGGELLPDLTAQALSLGVERRVHFPGRVGNPQAWYDAADAFALTSRFEGFPNALLEAIASGLPALAVDCLTGPSELIEDGINGVLLPASSDAHEVSAGLARLLGSEWPGTQDSSAGVRDTHSSVFIAQAWLQLFEQVRSRP
jgi:glycosyltransferase involved in cell wall biosynthesis